MRAVVRKLLKYCDYEVHKDTPVKKDVDIPHSGIESFVPDIRAKSSSASNKFSKIAFTIEESGEENESLASAIGMLYYVDQHEYNRGFVVVPSNKKESTKMWFNIMMEIIRAETKKASGRVVPTPVQIISFSDVTRNLQRREKYENTKAGAPPKCQFLPRS